LVNMRVPKSILRLSINLAKKRNSASSCYLGERTAEANLGLGVCGERIQLRVAGEIGGVAHIG